MKCRNKLCGCINPYAENGCCFVDDEVRKCKQRKLFNRIMSDFKFHGSLLEISRCEFKKRLNEVK